MHKCFIWLLRKTKKKNDNTTSYSLPSSIERYMKKNKYDIILNEDRKNKWTNLARTITTPNLCKCKLYLVSSKTTHFRFFLNYFSIQKELILIKYKEPPRTCLSTFGAWNLRIMNYCWSPKSCSEQPHQSQRMWGAKQL